MATYPNDLTSIEKLAIAGEQAGFTIEEMIGLLNSGVSIQTLLDMMALRLHGKAMTRLRPSRWIM